MRSKIALLVIVFAIEKTCILSLAAGVEGNLEQDDLGGIIDQEEIVDEGETTPKTNTVEQLPTNQLPSDQVPTEQLPTEQLPSVQLPADELPPETQPVIQPAPELNLENKLLSEEDLLKETELKDLANADGVIDDTLTDEELEDKEKDEEVEDTVPTGIEVIVVPFIILILLCIVLALVFRNKREEEDE